jgi:hypothetical protein
MALCLMYAVLSQLDTCKEHKYRVHNQPHCLSPWPIRGQQQHNLSKHNNLRGFALKGSQEPDYNRTLPPKELHPPACWGCKCIPLQSGCFLNPLLQLQLRSCKPISHPNQGGGAPTHKNWGDASTIPCRYISIPQVSRSAGAVLMLNHAGTDIMTTHEMMAGGCQTRGKCQCLGSLAGFLVPPVR